MSWIRRPGCVARDVCGAASGGSTVRWRSTPDNFFVVRLRLDAADLDSIEVPPVLSLEMQIEAGRDHVALIFIFRRIQRRVTGLHIIDPDVAIRSVQRPM